MKRTRRVIGSGLITAAFAVATATTAISVNAADASTLKPVSEQTKEEHTKAESSQNSEKMQENKKTAINWDKKVISKVGKDTYLNIRSKATVNSEVVGKLYRGAGATIKKKGKEWTKVKSGDVVGYVKNEYCAFGEEAQKLAEKLCDTHAFATGDGLRVRKGSSTDAKVVTVLEEGESIKVNTSAKEVDGWVPVKYDGKKAYVSADYVKVSLKIDDAVSIEEERESDFSGQETTNASVSASSGDLYLLAAIIECEAGGEPYAGQLAVGAVVMNRVQSGSFPNSISGVIYQSGQFSPVASGKLSRVLNSGKIGNSCYRAAKEALRGADNTGGAKFFHAGTNGSGTVIGTQIFY